MVRLRGLARLEFQKEVSYFISTTTDIFEFLVLKFRTRFSVHFYACNPLSKSSSIDKFRRLSHKCLEGTTPRLQ